MLPPSQKWYLLNANDAGDGGSEPSFADFFALDRSGAAVTVTQLGHQPSALRGGCARAAIDRRMNDDPPTRAPFSFAHFEVIDTAEMLTRARQRRALWAHGRRCRVRVAGDERDDRKARARPHALWRALRAAGATPHWKPMGACLLFTTTPSSGEVDPGASDFCDGRGVVRYAANRTLTEARILHLPTLPKQGLRWLTHFYSFIRFAEPMHDRFYRRFVRDHVRLRGAARARARLKSRRERERARSDIARACADPIR